MIQPDVDAANQWNVDVYKIILDVDAANRRLDVDAANKSKHNVDAAKR